MNILETPPKHWEKFKPYAFDPPVELHFPQHSWYKYRGKTLNWLDSDNEERWAEHMKDAQSRERLSRYGWTKDNVTYALNSYGFRCDEFRDDSSILCLGCSFTGGVGLPLDKIWPTVLADKLGLKCWNLGIGAGSMDTCFRFVNYFIDKLNIKYIFLLKPSYLRFDVYESDNICKSVLPSSTFNSTHNLLASAKQLWHSSDQNCIQNYMKNLMAIEYLCHSYKIKLYTYYTEQLYYTLFGPRISRTKPDHRSARDLMHLGSEYHGFMASAFFNMIE